MGFVHRRARAPKQLGIIEVKPVQTAEHGVFIMVQRGAVGFGSFDEGLNRAIAKKLGTLRAEHDLERHLGILVERWDRSSDPTDTPVPDIPPEIDVLWIVHAWLREGEEHPAVWVARGGATAWRVYD